MDGMNYTGISSRPDNHAIDTRRLRAAAAGILTAAYDDRAPHPPYKPKHTKKPRTTDGARPNGIAASHRYESTPEISTVSRGCVNQLESACPDQNSFSDGRILPSTPRP